LEWIFFGKREGTPALRIAIIVERFSPRGGGVENVAWQVAHELARVGEDVTVLTRSAASYPKLEESPGPRVHRLRVPSQWQPLRVVAFSRASTKAIRRGEFDVVHSFSRTRTQDLFRAGGGTHRDYLRLNHSKLGARLRQFSPRHRVLLSIEARVFADPNQRIQCASRLVEESLVMHEGVSPDRIFLLPNAVDASRYGSPAAFESGRRLRTELDEKAEQIWLFPASGWRRKGLRTLLHAIVHNHDPGLRLWIAGRDDPRPWQAMAESLGIADRVRFLGLRSDLETVYAAVDGMVLPTRYDAFANVTLEAAATGLPIITTRANGAAEALEGDVYLLETSDDPLSLAEALASFDTAEQREALGARAREKALRLDWAQHVSALRDEYRRILDARSSRPSR
jgi:UDP-glucose:(heptosyl)LPS alpha-1,3-glucosyltransferase